MRSESKNVWRAIRRTIRFFRHSCPCSLCVLAVSVIVDLLSKRSPQRTEREHRKISRNTSRAGPAATRTTHIRNQQLNNNGRECTHIAGVTSKPVNHGDGPHTVCILAFESGQREFRNEGTRIGWAAAAEDLPEERESLRESPPSSSNSDKSYCRHCCRH